MTQLIFRFDEEFSLEDSITEKVSDHYPVHCSFKPKVHPTIEKNIQFKTGIIAIDRVKYKKNVLILIHNIYLEIATN